MIWWWTAKKPGAADDNVAKEVVRQRRSRGPALQHRGTSVARTQEKEETERQVWGMEGYL